MAPNLEFEHPPAKNTDAPIDTHEQNESTYDDFEMTFPDQYHAEEITRKLTVVQENKGSDGKL